MSKPDIALEIKNILSDKSDVFKKEVSENLPAYVDTGVHDSLTLFKQYAYPVSSWPIIIDKKTSERIARLSMKLPSMIQQIPELYFNNDKKKIADYYFGGNEMISELALICHQKKVETSCRLDLSLSVDGFKILEVNVGSNLGGFQIQHFEPVIRKGHPQLSDKETASNYLSQNSITNYFSFIIDKIQEKNPSGQREINLFLIMDMNVPGFEKFKEKELDFFNCFYKNELRNRGCYGRAIGGDPKILKMSKGKLKLNDLDISAVLRLERKGKEMPKSVFRAFLMDAIYFPDHLAIDIYSDKRNLGLLRELAEQQKFNLEDNNLIIESIPCTYEIKDRKVVFKGQEIGLIDLIQNNKESFVIKHGMGFQGTDVYVGKFLTDEEWGKVIQLALKEKGFLAQEFCDSLVFEAPNMNNQWTPHKLIWGAFGYGKKYGGVWVRMCEEKNSDGVINSAKGAIEAIVFEITN